MSEPKTQPTDASVQAFLETAATPRRVAEGLQLTQIFSEVTGTDPVMWGPTMVGYGSYHYISQANPRTRGVWPKTGFSPRKAKISLYSLKDLPAGALLLPKLGKFTEGMGCTYVNKLEDIDLGVLRKLIAIAWTKEDDPEPS